MTRKEKIEFIWNAALERASGSGHADPFAYADKAAAEFRARHPLPRKPYHGPSAGGSRAGLRQYRERHST